MMGGTEPVASETKERAITETQRPQQRHIQGKIAGMTHIAEAPVKRDAKGEF